MRKARLKIEGDCAVYHIITRVVDGQLLLDDIAKERLRIMARENARFSGVEIITQCVMGNHFHLLVRVAAQSAVSDAELLRRAAGYYGEKSPYRKLLEQTFSEFGGKLPGDLRTGLASRMGDISFYMKELKQRFTKWFNKRHGRFGTLWSERFKSVIVEDEPSVVSTVAAYIDLNPVRAGLVSDPKDYRWCGYAEAVAGDRDARSGLAGFHEKKGWSFVSSEYRKLLFVKSGVSGRSDKTVLDREAIKRVVEEGGELALAEVLRLRIRYFSDGVALGSREFVDSVFAEFRDRFGAHRKSGARDLRGLRALGAMKTLRNLQVAPFG
jgi:putative transposase